jgi:hypothetical protein
MLFQSSDFDPPMLFSLPGGVDGLGISRMDARTGRREYSRVARQPIIFRKSKNSRRTSGRALTICGRTSLKHHATHCSYEAKADKAAGKMPDRPLVKADFTRRRSNLESWHILRRI